jgi:SAM-dependent methyltransferase
MTQNIYDDSEFFAGYSRLKRSVEGLDGAPEWPTLRSLLPELHGRRVLDLGCGFGWFCRWARQQGAAHVLGVDVSERMLTRARADTSEPAIRYLRADMEDIELSGGSFDLAYSSLALHYVVNLDRLAREVHGSLVPGGSLVFSAEHPMFTAPAKPGWAHHSDGRATWPIDSYLDQGPRSTDWLTRGVIKHHRTVAAYLNLLIRCGFTIAHVEEWGPSAEQIAAYPEWAGDRQRPPFLLVGARRT